jgi:hypothetical protein
MKEMKSSKRNRENGVGDKDLNTEEGSNKQKITQSGSARTTCIQHNMRGCNTRMELSSIVVVVFIGSCPNKLWIYFQHIIYFTCTQKVAGGHVER